MMINRFFIFIFMWTFMFLDHSFATEKNIVCNVINKDKGVVAYLINKNGEISKGPIDFGIYKYSYKSRDFVLIPTDYRLIVKPGRITVSGTGEGIMGVTAVLRPSTNICPDSKTYTITYATREARSNSQLDAWQLPYSENVQMETASMDDPKQEVGDFKIAYKFDSRFVGQIVDGSKK